MKHKPGGSTRPGGKEAGAWYIGIVEEISLRRRVIFLVAHDRSQNESEFLEWVDNKFSVDWFSVWMLVLFDWLYRDLPMNKYVKVLCKGQHVVRVKDLLKCMRVVRTANTSSPIERIFKAIACSHNPLQSISLFMLFSRRLFLALVTAILLALERTSYIVVR
jgi:hypothetical protein